MSYPPNHAGGPAPAPKQGMSTGAKIAAFGCGIPAVLLVLLIGCGAVLTAGGDDVAEDTTTEAAEADSDGDGGTEENAPEEEAPEEEAPEDDGVVVGDGIHRIGDDIPAGDYTTAGPEADAIVPSCYYARLSGTSGEFDEIIANNNTEGAATVTVDESDAALELSGGCEWELMD
ncbi:hypothetical protein [Nocardiopsis salina]|uniref:hypothetical protein n=1 Tax=Nocardiopsis salina TaxID=245836 RepID=UPI0003773CF5|nr:hypothetical protein [Nocardiopsis salina]